MPRQNAPRVAGVPLAPATRSNSSRSGPGPSRLRASVSDPVRAGRQPSRDRRGQCSTNSRSTRPYPYPVNSHIVRTKYTASRAGSDRVRSSRAPASSTTKSTSSGVKVRDSKPIRIRSGYVSPAM
jgi:hypothetical protein